MSKNIQIYSKQHPSEPLIWFMYIVTLQEENEVKKHFESIAVPPPPTHFKTQSTDILLQLLP